MSRESNFARKVVITSPEKKPSVFERLGTKSRIVCTQNGTCPLNKQCKFSETHLLINQAARLKSDTMKKSVVTHKKCKIEHKKSLRSHHNTNLEWEGWELGDLEDADERVLEKRKQELQRELQLQLKKEKELTRKKEKRNEKKRAASSSSSSTTTTESSSSSTSSSTSSSEPRKHQNRKRKHSSSSSESERSIQRQKKTQKSDKTKLTTVKKPTDKKDAHGAPEVKSKSVITKKSVASKKTYGPNWDKSRVRSPPKQQIQKNSSPHRSPEASKNKSSSPRYEKTGPKNKRSYSPKPKSKESSPKKVNKKSKEIHGKEKSRSSPLKVQNSPPRSRKVSPARSRRHEDTSEKRRQHYEDQKYTNRRDRSREKDKKRDMSRCRSNDNDNNGGLKKGGKILPLKPPTVNKDGGKREPAHHKSVTDVKSKEDMTEKERNRSDRDKDRGERDKNKFERDKPRYKKSGDDHDRRQPRERETDRNSVRSRDDRGRERETERSRFMKERESERQKERDEALERCRERQRERERLEKERKEKDEKKNQRGTSENKVKGYDRELPSLLDLKAENPSRISGDSGRAKSNDQHPMRDCHRIGDKPNEKVMVNHQEREVRDRVSIDRDHDRRDSRRSDEPDRKPQDKDYDCRKSNRDDVRNCTDVRGRTATGDGCRRGGEEEGESRRQWGEEATHDRRRPADSNGDRRQPTMGRRPVEDTYRRPPPRDNALSDTRDFPMDDRRGGDPEKRDDWHHSDRHRDWNSRYEHKWVDRSENRDDGWSHYVRRGPHEDWNGDWPQEQPRQIYQTEADRLEGYAGKRVWEGYNEQNGKRHNETVSVDTRRADAFNKDKEIGDKQKQDRMVSTNRGEKSSRGEGDVLSDISDDPDDILNQDDFPAEDALPQQNIEARDSNQQIYIRSNDFLFDRRRPLLECLGERSLDFEEISDEELEEEARANKGIVDVLGADWAALLRATQPKAKRPEGLDSAQSRWVMKNLISKLGISLKYAGQEFIDRVLEKCHETEENGVGILKVKNSGEEESAGTKMKTQEGKVEGTDLSDSTHMPMDEQKDNININAIFHSIPALHSTLRDVDIAKSTLFSSHNRFKRALSARTDLSLRRELCNLPAKEPLHFTPPLDNRMYEASIQQFHGGATTTAAV